MKNIKKVLKSLKLKNGTRLLSLLVTLLAVSLTKNNVNLVKAEAETVDAILQQKRIPTLQDDFDDNKVVVVLNQKDSSFDKTVEIQDFGINLERAGLISYSIYDTDKIVDKFKLKTYGKSIIKNHAIISDLFNFDTAKYSKGTKDNELFRILSIELPVRGKDKVLQAIEELEKSEIVYSAEPKYNDNAIDLWIPNDTYFTNNQWGLTGTNGIKAEDTWDYTRGNLDIRIGLFESGAQQNHPDLNGRFIDPNFNIGARDHGTHVAGIVGAISNNSRGIAGIAQSNMLLLNRNDFVNSLSYAANQGVWIINASFQYTKSDSEGYDIPANLNTSHAAAIWDYGMLGGLLICAAGNGIRGVAQNNDITPSYPSSYSIYTIPRKTNIFGFETQPARPITNVISVGSIDSDGLRSDFSNYGPNSVQIFAPGRDILSTFPTTNWGSNVDDYNQVAQGYAITSGTSMAAPHVTGVAALIRSLDISLTPVQIKNAILNNVSYPMDGNGNNPLSGLCSSGGILNAYQTITSVAYYYSISGDNATIQGVNFNPIGQLILPNTIGGKTVNEIGISALSGKSQLIQISIPSTVTHIGSNAFLNTNSARIDLVGRTSSPSTFDANWNPSNNPVYFNGVECLHTSKTLTYISGGKHGLMCNQCRTSTNVTEHPSINLWMNEREHHSKCNCGLNQVMAHVVSSSDPGYPYKTCLYCGGPAKDAIGQYDKGSSIITVVPSLFIKEYFGNGSYILQNGIYVISDEDLSSFYDGTLILPEKCDDCHEHFELHNCIDCMYN